MLRRIARGVIAAGAGSFALALLAVTLLLVASAGAPAPVERRPMDYDDRPAGVVADVIHNLGAAEYTYDLSVASGEGLRDGESGTLVEHVEVDNHARRYRSSLAVSDRRGDIRVRFYADAFEGHRAGPAVSWSSNGGFGYGQLRNAFETTPPRDASATVVAENGTTYVARITDPSVAADVAYPDVAMSLRSGVGDRPPTPNATANLTVTVDKRTGHVTRAVLRYRNPPDAPPGDRPDTVGLTYEFSDYGATAVGRPLATNPPRLRTLVYRLDLGVWALTEGHGPARVAALVGRLVVVGLVVALVALGLRRAGREAEDDGAGAAAGRRLHDAVADRVVDATADRVPAVDWDGRARTALRGYAALLSTLWLVAVTAVLASAAVGPAPTPDATDAPAIDLDDAPAEVAADAAARLQYRSHSIEYWIRERNRTDGSVRGGIAADVRVQHSAERVRIRVYRSAFYEGWTRPSDPHLDFYGTTATRHQRYGPDGAWRRIIRNGYVYHRDRQFRPWAAETFRGVDGTVHDENATALVLVFTDSDVVDVVGPPLENATDERVTVVVRKRPSPHLAWVAYRGRTPDRTLRWTYRVSGVGSTVVERPDRAPPAPVTEALHRMGQGFWRIVGWLP